ncbi:hypothetical protein QL285_071317 [Trifolium repens]|nr:hypothetical protein QL285_071317 [Trifolium repens]
MILLREYQLTNAIQPSLRRPNVPENNNHNIIWNPPSRRFMKINVDAHVLRDGRCFSGMILRRWDGSTVGIATRAHQFVTDALEGEALGLSDAIDMVESYNSTDVIFELDNQVIVRAVQRRSQIRRQWGHAVQRCINFIKRNPRSSISWVSRKGNRVAHVLARWAENNHIGDWPNWVPYCIHNHVLWDILWDMNHL